ncbi:hypothetical protein A3C37_00660 [Candidatus Peribacteria bacterium RIFCSPHIGHO2_02_FULL_53_20]|nr:MAG: hypothetical protein A3C37_00660 [Candidatus Peribacteria bacterium RIFCSPHIGHO2_02_FULL_53_20]OGJ65794.1 MAG: hypothetical protein A3B61_00995 [Candidatus Peribacteria bacterium RIFCSPLOWO2_01_FULL_53_10]OGJ72798.1 MAG: hypothetical protein A3G69_00320 [Candidatus Peribacteria bacterium RIFCSPLOWO2_12_FULL_53_10]
MRIRIFDKLGAFAGNKDVAMTMREKAIIPALEKGEEVIIDFENVEGATQSFIHALISDPMRKFGIDVLDKMKFQSCKPNVAKIIRIVTSYMQAGLGDDE